jgi:hypothetical protein
MRREQKNERGLMMPPGYREKRIHGSLSSIQRTTLKWDEEPPEDRTRLYVSALSHYRLPYTAVLCISVYFGPTLSFAYDRKIALARSSYWGE